MSKNHPKIYPKPPNGGYGKKQRDLALLKTWPRYWQKGRVKRCQNSLQVYPRLNLFGLGSVVEHNRIVDWSNFPLWLANRLPEREKKHSAGEANRRARKEIKDSASEESGDVPTPPSAPGLARVFFFLNFALAGSLFAGTDFDISNQFVLNRALYSNKFEKALNTRARFRLYYQCCAMRFLVFTLKKMQRGYENTGSVSFVYFTWCSTAANTSYNPSNLFARARLV